MVFLLQFIFLILYLIGISILKNFDELFFLQIFCSETLIY